MADYAAIGELQIFGLCFGSDPPPADGYATGGVSISGAVESDTLYPPNVDARANGGLDLVSFCRCEQVMSPVRQATAAGWIAITGPCQGPDQTPTVTPPSVLDHQASGNLSITGPCVGDTIIPQMDGGIAAGSIQIGGFPGCAGQTLYPEINGQVGIASGYIQIFSPSKGDSEKPPVYNAVAAVGFGVPVLLIGSDCAGGTIYPRIDEFLASGGIAIVNPVPNQAFREFFETWSLTGQMYEPGLHTNFDFNSFCVHRGHAYGCKEDGIYLLEGADDDGKKIHTGVRMGPHNFGIDTYKRLRTLRLAAIGGATVRVTTGEGDLEGEIQNKAEMYYDSVDGHCPVTQELQGREWIIEVADFLQLTQVEILVAPLFRRSLVPLIDE